MKEVMPQFGSQPFFSATVFNMSKPWLPHLQHGVNDKSLSSLPDRDVINILESDED